MFGHNVTTKAKVVSYLRLCYGSRYLQSRSSQFQTAQSTAKGKQSVVIESGVSGHDIAQYFHEHGHQKAQGTSAVDFSRSIALGN